MAVFNPEVPKSTGSEIPAMHFPFISREISNLTPNRAGAVLGEGVGRALEQGSSLVDKAYDSIVTADTRAEVDPMEKEYQDQLRDTYDTILGNKNAQGGGGSPQGGTSNLPPQLKELPRQLDLMEASRANGKKSETEHYQDLVDLTTRLRNRFPGKRDLIDSEVSRISGVHPANRLIQSRLADINSFINSSKEGKNKVNTDAVAALKDGDLDYSVYAKWKQNGDDSLIYRAIAAGGKRRADYTNGLHDLELRKGAYEQNQRNAESFAMVSGHKALDSAMDNFYMAADLEHPMKMKEFITAATRGDIKATGPQLEELKTNLAGFSQNVMSKIKAEWAKPLPGYKPGPNDDPNDNGSLAYKLGDKQEEVLKKIQDEIEGWTSLIGNPKDAGLADLVARQIKATAAAGERGLETDPQLGQISIMAKAIKDRFGPEGLVTFIEQNKTAWDKLNTMDQKSEFMTNANKLVSEPSIKTGDIDTLKGMFERARTKGIQGQDGAHFYDQTLDLVTSMLGKDIPDEVRASVVNRVFGVDNLGVTKLFSKDNVSSQGIPVNQQFQVFDRLLNPQSVDKVWKLSKDTANPTYFNNMKTWTEFEFADLFRNHIHDLNLTGHDYSGVDIAYDAQSHKFYSKSISGENTRVPPALDRLLKNINSGLGSMNRLYEKSGEDTNLYLYRLLDASGLSSELEQKMQDAIVSAHQSRIQE